MLIRLDRVAKFFGSKLVFKDVSFALEAGNILLLAGPNGAGKSTLLKCVAGLEQPSSGVCDNAVPDAQVGYLGHQTFIYPQLSALENLEFWSRLHGLRLDQKALLKALEQVGLAHTAHERAGRFSRGMAQRLSLARVFLPEPRLLLLDEPDTGLDKASCTLLFETIAAARNKGAGIIWVSHRVERDIALADSILELGKSKPAYCGPADVYARETGLC